MRPVVAATALGALLCARGARAQEAPPRRSTVEAVALYGWLGSYGAATGLAASLTLDGERLPVGTALPLLGAGLGAGVLTAYLIDRGPGVRPGVATALGAGLSLGAIAGGAIALEGAVFSDWTPRAATITAWSGLTVGLGAALALEAALRPSPGVTSWALSGGLWGATLSGLLAVAARDGEHVGRWILVGEAVGVIASLATARMMRPTQARTRWLDLGGVVGGLLGFGAGMLLFSRPSLNLAGVVATTQLGIIGGGVGGWFLAPRETDLDR